MTMVGFWRMPDGSESLRHFSNDGLRSVCGFYPGGKFIKRANTADARLADCPRCLAMLKRAEDETVWRKEE
jgi:hypothetical protein